MEEEICQGKPANWIVVGVEAREDYKLILTFITGERKVYDATSLLKKSIFAPLREISFFMKAKVVGDSVAWSDELDIAPEHLYECSTEISEEEYAKVSEQEEKKYE